MLPIALPLVVLMQTLLVLPRHHCPVGVQRMAHAVSSMMKSVT